MRAIAALVLLAFALTGCVVGGGLNYHFDGKPSWVRDEKADAAKKKCDPTRGSAERDCPPPDRAAR
jgi:hypothetical protein